MNATPLAVGLLLLGQLAGGEADPSSAGSPPPAQLPALPEDRPPGRTDSEAAAAAPAAEDSVAVTAADTAPARLPDSPASPPALIAAALRPREGGSRGEPLALAAALDGIADRSRQADVVHTYWRLAEAVGRANLAQDFAGRLESVETAGNEAAVLRSARATAAAAAEEAAAEVVSLQHELSALLPRSAEGPLPRPSDSPHVGPYLTYFDRLRAAGRAPASALVIDRRLSILWRAIEARAAAVAAAEDAYRLASAAPAQGDVETRSIVEAAEQAHRQHRALLEVVVRYNRDIAGYALLVAPPATAGPALVRMLIEQEPEPLRPIPAGDGVRPTLATEPAEGPRTFAAPPEAGSAAPSPDPRQPTRAVRAGAEQQPTPAAEPGAERSGPADAATPPGPGAGGSAAASPEPNPAEESERSPRRPGGSPSGDVPSPDNEGSPASSGEGLRSAEESGGGLPSLITPPPGGWHSGEARGTGGGRPSSENAAVEAAGGEEPLSSTRPVVPVTPDAGPGRVAAPEDILGLPPARPPKEGVAPQQSLAPQQGDAAPAPRAAFRLRPSGGSAGDASAASTPALYEPLRDTTPGRRAKQLALTLHWDRTLPEGAGEPIDLASCLSRCSLEDRPKLLAAYWRVREAAAGYQVLAQQSAWLAALEEYLEPLGSPAAAEPLRLRSARLAARAEAYEAHAALVEAQFDLAVLLGRSLEDVWPMAATPPHAGPYLAKLEDQPAEVAASPVVRRRAGALPRLGEAVAQYAAAVVEADAARADAAADYATGSGSLEALERAIRRQTTQTLAFLRALSDYNRAIAGYALAVLPLEVPAETLVSALVVR